MGEWISVEDRLPDPDAYVLVVQVYEKYPMIARIASWGYWVEQCENLAVDGDATWSRDICKVKGAADYERITHWMPLPAAPVAE